MRNIISRITATLPSSNNPNNPNNPGDAVPLNNHISNPDSPDNPDNPDNPNDKDRKSGLFKKFMSNNQLAAKVGKFWSLVIQP